MGLGVKIFFMMILASFFLLIQSSFIAQSIVMEESVTAVETSSVNTYQNISTLDASKKEIIDEWLINFISNYNLNLEQIEIKFEIVSREPQVLIVSISGYDESLSITNGSSFHYRNGILVE